LIGALCSSKPESIILLIKKLFVIKQNFIFDTRVSLIV
jgi:hypothetical protein